MTEGQLVKVTHIGPGPLFGTAPIGGVLGTVGKVGVVYRVASDGVEVLFPDGARYVYTRKELEPVMGPKGPVHGTNYPQGWEVAD